MDSLKLSTLGEVNEALDQILLRQLQLLQDYPNLTLESEREMKEGYFQLARSRYNMGSNSVSKAYLPCEDSERDYKATITVVPESDEDNGKEKVIPSRRKLQLSSIRENETETEGSSKQFGILTSVSLKTAQKSFRQTLEKTLERINTSSELHVLEKQFKELSTLKKQLVAQEE